MEYNVRVKCAGGVLAIAAVVGVSVVTSTVVASRAYEERGRAAAARADDIAVRGSARARITSDLAVWVIRIRGDGPELKAAYEKLESAASRVSDFLAKAGFAESEIALSAIDTAVHYKQDDRGHDTHEIAGYTLDRVFTVTSPRTGQVAAASTAVTELIKDNVRVISARPDYYCTKLAELRLSIAGEAARDARARAEEVATRAGCRLGPVRELRTGPIQVTAPNSTEVSGSGSYETETIDKDISVTVNATYGIES